MKNTNIYLIHILECIENIEEYTKTGKEEFVMQKIIQDAVIRNLEILGEATKKNTIRSKSKISWYSMERDGWIKRCAYT